jgi:hypothetical protein
MESEMPTWVIPIFPSPALSELMSKPAPKVLPEIRQFVILLSNEAENVR